MTHNHSDNAVMTKVRALYGKRLTSADYDALLRKKTVGEVASYLQKETYYSENLQEIKEELIHRGQLELLVSSRALNTYSRLLKYSSADTLYLTLYVMDNEINQLLTAIRLLNSGSIDRYIVSLPVRLARLMSFDLFALAKIQTYDDLLSIVEHSDYYRVMGRFRPMTADKMVDITGCEAALLTHYYRRALFITNRDYRGETREDLAALFRFKVNLHNISVIFRMRRYLKSPADMIRPRLVEIEGDKYRRLYEQLITADSLEEMQRLLDSRPILRRHELDWTGDTQSIASEIHHIRRDLNRRRFRYSVKPVVVVLTYMTLLHIEMQNIVNVIEGIRYGLPPADIKRLLTI